MSIGHDAVAAASHDDSEVHPAAQRAACEGGCGRRVFLAVVLAELVACSGEAPPQGPPNPAINETTSHDLSQVVFAQSIPAITGWNYNARQYHDLDGDGVAELIVAPWDFDKQPDDMIIYRDSGAGYAPATAQFFDGPVPQSIWARKLLEADFNGDGKVDFYVADTGDDYAPFPGAENALVLSGPDGRLSQYRIPDAPTLFQHCAAAGDIDNNGTIDLFVGSNPFGDGDKSSYLVINDGHGGYRVTRDGVPRWSLRTRPVFTCELVDVDGDGYLDLITGSQESAAAGAPPFPTMLHWGNGTGAFSDASAVVLPQELDYAIVLDFDAADLDGDGARDLVVLRTSDVPQFYTGYYIQILVQSPARSFTDQSLARIIGDKASWQGKGAQWIDWLRVLDVTGDGTPDIVTDDAWLGRRYVWSNGGDGAFTRAQ